MKLDYSSIDNFMLGCRDVVQNTLRRNENLFCSPRSNRRMPADIQCFIDDCASRGITRLGIYGACENIRYLLDVDTKTLSVPCLVDSRKKGNMIGLPVVSLKKSVEEFGCEAFVITARSFEQIENTIQNTYPTRSFPIYSIFRQKCHHENSEAQRERLELHCKSVAQTIDHAEGPKVIYIAKHGYPSIPRQSRALRTYRGWDTTMIFWHDVEATLDDIDYRSFSRIYSLKENIIPKSGYLQLHYILKHLKGADTCINVCVDTIDQELVLAVKSFTDLPVVYQPIDLLATTYHKDIYELLWEKERVSFAFAAEEYLFSNVSGIIHKESPVTETMISPAARSPMLNFFDFAFEDLCMPVKNEVHEPVRLVYVGSFHPTYWPDEAQNVSRQFHRAATDLIGQGITIDVYGGDYHGLGKDHQAYIEWRLLEKRHPGFFKMHAKLPRDEIVKELSRYDFGVVNGFNHATGLNENPNLFLTTMATKMFAFIEAGIPMIITKDFSGMAAFIKEHGIGIVIEKKEIANLKTVLMKTDYGKLCRNLEKARKKDLGIEKHIPRLDGFYRKMMSA